MKLRSLLIVVLGLALVGAILYSQRDTLSPRSQETLPLNLSSLLPADWVVLSDGIASCDYDADGAQEWLVLYEYDHTELAERFLIGGIIFDTQSGGGGQTDGTPNPYRPELLIPYRLLPDIYPGKGQGYLGESRVALSLYSPARAEAGSGCRAEEIVVSGYSDASVDASPSRVSVFRWRQTDQSGYQVAHFVGNARVETSPAGLPAQSDQPLQEVRTYNRLNERSQLCEVHGYRRQQSPLELTFVDVVDEYSIDFCFEAPAEPAYPEGAVIALLRGDSPDASSPTGSSYLTSGAADSLPDALRGLAANPRSRYRVLSFGTQGTVIPSGGSQITTGGAEWWVGREQADVTTVLDVGGVRVAYTWRLISYTNARASTDIRWRVVSVGEAE